MASDAKKTRQFENGSAAFDRISSLPTSLMELILERLPTHDAARTSVFSKTWRNVWGMHPRLHLDEHFISQLVSQKFSELDEQSAAILKKFPRAMENLKYLYLHRIELYDLIQIQHVLCLVRSSPYLHTLDIDLDHGVQSSDGMDLLDLATLSDHMIRLETLKIYDLIGSRAEFQFLKLLLASSPSLKRIELKMKDIVDDPTEELRISQELLQIPRASNSAQIQWM
ncbi:hypothetical protein AgCh_019700 [Apium graveolens]